MSIPEFIREIARRWNAGEKVRLAQEELAYVKGWLRTLSEDVVKRARRRAKPQTLYDLAPIFADPFQFLMLEELAPIISAIDTIIAFNEELLTLPCEVAGAKKGEIMATGDAIDDLPPLDAPRGAIALAEILAVKQKAIEEDKEQLTKERLLELGQGLGLSPVEAELSLDWLLNYDLARIERKRISASPGIIVIPPFDEFVFPTARLRPWLERVKQRTLDRPQQTVPATLATDTAGANLMRKTKRSTKESETEQKLISALTKHHRYDDGSCLNQEPIGNNELARLAGVSESTASEFFSRQFGGHSKYKAMCRDNKKLIAALKLLNDDFAPHHLMGDADSRWAEPDSE